MAVLPEHIHWLPSIHILERDTEAATTEQVWKKHHTMVQEYQGKGMHLATPVSFENWVEIENRFDQSNVTSVVSLGVMWVVLLIWAIYRVVTNGVSIIDTTF